MTLLDDLQTTIATTAERVGPSVVGLGRGWSAGSGVVVGDGLVATVAHAIRRGEPTVAFADGRRAEASIAGVDRDANLAVLSVDTGDAPAAELAAERPGLGAAVLALADPGGRGLRTSLGFVTVADRGVRGPRGRRLSGAIEHSAPLPRGSSGGPLVDAAGHVVGLNAIRLEGGLILAVPIASDLVERLARGERVEPRRLGVALAPPHIARRMRRAVGLPERDGLLVRGVRDGSPADRAGLRRGDLIVSVAGSEADRLDALHAAIDSGAPTVELGVVRGTEEFPVPVAFDPDVETV
jgi:serine protease Do